MLFSLARNHRGDFSSEIMDNRVFYQHPDLMRSLCVHETVMAIMVNRLNKSKQEQTSMSSTNEMDGLAQVNEGGDNQETHPAKVGGKNVMATTRFGSFSG